MDTKPKTTDYLDEFVGELKKQLDSDYERWGNTWLERPREGQEYRILDRINAYYSDFNSNKIPVPWLKIAGLALIAWIRENHTELFDR